MREGREGTAADAVGALPDVQLLARALHGSALGVLITDAVGVIRYVNPALCERSGYQRDEVIGSTPELFWVRESSAAFHERIWRHIVSGRVWSGEVVNRHKDGSLHAVALDVSPIRGDDGVIAGYLRVSRVLQEDAQDDTSRTMADGATGVPAEPPAALAPDTVASEATEAGAQPAAAAVATSGAGQFTSRRDLLAQLQHALARDELVLHYQPQVSLHSGDIVGVEALVRWAHPQFGLIPPGQFIPFAEEGGLIIPIGEWVLERACAQAAAWQAVGLPPVRMGVNVSARHFRYARLAESVRSVLARCRLDAKLLELELTESSMMHDAAAAISIGDALKEQGVHLALDDFGTGYSSLAYLSRFAIDALKIDQSFVRDITTNATNASIASATIAMAHKLGKTVIAEGVETEGQMQALRRQQCDEMQGYLFAPALPADAIAQRLARVDRLDVHGARPRSASAQRLLLVDDEPHILSSLRRLLRREGYELFTAGSGVEGLELLARERIHVIVSDQRMPGMSGTEFLGKVKSMYPDTVRIVLSGYADIASVTEAINQGAIYKYFSKPWDDDVLKSDLRIAFRYYRERARGTQPSSADGETVW